VWGVRKKNNNEGVKEFSYNREEDRVLRSEMDWGVRLGFPREFIERKGQVNHLKWWVMMSSVRDVTQAKKEPKLENGSAGGAVLGGTRKKQNEKKLEGNRL